MHYIYMYTTMNHLFHILAVIAHRFQDKEEIGRAFPWWEFTYTDVHHRVSCTCFCVCASFHVCAIVARTFECVTSDRDFSFKLLRVARMLLLLFLLPLMSRSCCFCCCCCFVHVVSDAAAVSFLFFVLLLCFVLVASVVAAVLFLLTLTFKIHAAHAIARLISKSVGILFKLSKYLPLAIMKTWYYSHISPFLLYGIIVVWHGTYANITNKIFSLQKKAGRANYNLAAFHYSRKPILSL